jgi:prevent-host-death family protein
MHEAKTQLSRLLDLIQEGEEVILHRHGKPVARLAPVRQRDRSPFGAMRGEFQMKEGWSGLSRTKNRTPSEKGSGNPSRYEYAGMDSRSAGATVCCRARFHFGGVWLSVASYWKSSSKPERVCWKSPIW